MLSEKEPPRFGFKWWYARASLAQPKLNRRQQNTTAIVLLEIVVDGVHVNAKARELK